MKSLNRMMAEFAKKKETLGSNVAQGAKLGAYGGGLVTTSNIIASGTSRILSDKPITITKARVKGGLKGALLGGAINAGIGGLAGAAVGAGAYGVKKATGRIKPESKLQSARRKLGNYISGS